MTPMEFRKMRRFRQVLSEEKCAQILSEEKRGVLAVSGDGGYPYALPLNFWFDPARKKIYFHGAPAGHKIDSIRRSDKVSFCVYTRGEKPEDDWAYYVDSVIVFGRIRIVEDRAAAIGAARQLGLKYYPDAESVEEEIARDGARVCILELSVEHMTGKHVHEK